MNKNKKIIIGNIKMNILSKDEREEYLNGLLEESEVIDFDKVDVVVCPPTLHLEAFSDKLKDSEIKVGSQNVYWESKGAFTGEISVDMVGELGGNYSIVGHSERRQYFCETDKFVNLKIKKILDGEMCPIFCFGETKEERDSGVARNIIADQIAKGLEGVSGERVGDIIFAYEPVWSIGSNSIPSSDDIMEVMILVKKILIAKYGEDVSGSVVMLYGGSVNADNVKDVMSSGIDGVLVGGQSLKPSSFVELIKMIGE